MLTGRQDQLLSFLRHRATTSLISPTFDEMKDHLGLASKSGIHRIIRGLEERGFIRGLRNRARSIRVIDSTVPVHDPVKAAEQRVIAAARVVATMHLGHEDFDALRMALSGLDREMA